MGTRVEAAMLFVPSVDGRSHSPADHSTPHDCAHGASVPATAEARYGRVELLCTDDLGHTFNRQGR